MYRPQAVKFYAGQSIASEGGSLLCSVSGCEVPAADITAGHIYQQRWPILVSGTTEFNVEMLCVMGMTRLVLDLDLSVNLYMNGGALISRAFLLLT